ncbi:hypothetical protein U6A24_14505 [Aquimarina gracilis]|uniref:Uncharacterized protein n=1 Tax=Aquimarina gracilis TaxID=874422 RepID=A0ABU5ZXV3_9FLAO|nr:hypothetical protein [Aquimarina gracilis]MEB3346686.1 hypothetical protein [Aquimarina gracilis]
MKRGFPKNMRHNLYRILPMLFMTPSIVLGVFTMYYHNVSSSIWLQNLAGLIMVSIFSYFILSHHKLPKTNSSIVILLSILLLTLTFIHSGTGNVHRYLSIGIISLNIGSIVLPILLIELEKIVRLKNWWLIVLLTLGVITILFFQPDASKVTAFSIAALFFLSKHVMKKIQYVVLSLPVLMSILSWFFLDELPPVDYVEGILSMTWEMGIVLFILAVLSLIVLPLPFFLFKTRINQSISISLGIYFSIVLLSTIFGNFPVPLLGYGISPIIGYTIAITWLIKNSELKKTIHEE